MEKLICKINDGSGLRTVECERGVRLIELVREDVDSPCGGNGTCGKCRVIASGGLSLPSEHERALLGCDISRGIRLACLASVEGDCEITLEAREAIKIETSGITQAIAEADLAPICGRIADKMYGLAVDVGTTTVACYLCDLSGRGEIVDVRSFMNPQRGFGADVISRIAYTIENGDGDMRSAIIEAINEEAGSLCSSCGISRCDIYAAVITGNTVMQHFIAGDDASGIANAPFTPSSLYGYSISAETLGLSLAEGAGVYLTPCFAAYVGGDIASGIAAAELDLSDETVLFIDVGTNGEMALRHDGGFVLCATAAGPAFEGAHIKYGMGGAPGAISKVWVEGDSVGFETIGGIPPVGICGSGLIDAVACMLELGALDETGYLEDDFILDEASGICITGGDIRELQLAKASICAGINTVLDDAGIEYGDIDRVVLAGGFGAHIDRRSACRIGMIPPALEERIIYAGNTAGMGAVRLLSSASMRARVARIPELSRYLELSQNGFFMEDYVEQMMFE